MHMDDLWIDVAIRGEPHVEDELIVRLKLSDGAEPGPGPDAHPSALDDLRPAPTV